MFSLKRDLPWLVLIAASSIHLLFLTQKNGLDWPAMSTAPAIMRSLNSSTLAGDFMANSASSGGPRQPWNLVLLKTAGIFDFEWWDAFYFFKILFTFLLPPLIFLVLQSALGGAIALRSRILLAIAVAIPTLHPKLVSVFTLAWWPALELQAVPQNLAMVFLFAGWLWPGPKGIFVFTCAALAAFFHPPVTVFAAAFVFLIHLGNLNLKKSALMFLGAVTGAVLLSVSFKGAPLLSANELARTYAMVGHPFHYWWPQYGSYSGMPAIATLVLIVGLAATRSWIFAALPIACVGGQILFTQLLPWRPVIELGPTRVMAFAYWWLVFLLILKFSAGRGDVIVPPGGRRSRIAAIGFAGVLGLSFWILRDRHPLTSLRASHLALYEFVESTAPDSLFLIYHGDLLNELPLVTGRGVAIGDGFPFNESYYQEYATRRCAVFGCGPELWRRPGTWIGEKYLAHYRSLRKEDFLQLREQYGVRYAIVESAQDQAFTGAAPVFQDSENRVFDLARIH